MTSTDSWAERFQERREAELALGRDVAVPGARFNSSPA